MKKMCREVSNLTEDVRFDVLPCSCPPEEQQDGQEACIILEQKFCQSCGMPLTGAPQELGTEKDGSPNPDYCTYCYQNGAFTRDCTMQEMIDFCTPIMAQNHPGMTESDAAARMRSFFPQLKRWEERSLSETEAAKKLFGRFGGAQPSDLHSEPSDMCGRFGRLAQQGSGC